MSRQIVLDTETTGLEPSQGHRIIEIGCVELVGRRLTGNNFHVYINPEREIDAAAIEVHGITNEFLADKPQFADVSEEFIRYVRDAELIIHNAPFDVGFLNHELKRLASGDQAVDEMCGVIDTLVMARRMHPGARNSLDALCKRYEVDNSQRDLHGALLDAEILADVYLAMTGGQVSLNLAAEDVGAGEGEASVTTIRRLSADRPPLPVITASADEKAAHDAFLELIDKSSDGGTLWRDLQ